MIILIPIDRRPSITHMDTVGRFKNHKDDVIELRSLRIRQGRKYRTVLVVRLISEYEGDEMECQRYLVSEVLNNQKDGHSVDTFYAARVPKIVAQLVDDWTCEYVHESHDLLTWRTKMGDNYDDGLQSGLMAAVFGHGDFTGLLERLREPYAVEENSPLTDSENSGSIELETNDGSDEMPSAFDSYFRSDDWKHSVE